MALTREPLFSPKRRPLAAAKRHSQHWRHGRSIPLPRPSRSLFNREAQHQIGRGQKEIVAPSPGKVGYFLRVLTQLPTVLFKAEWQIGVSAEGPDADLSLFFLLQLQSRGESRFTRHLSVSPFSAHR